MFLRREIMLFLLKFQNKEVKQKNGLELVGKKQSYRKNINKLLNKSVKQFTHSSFFNGTLLLREKQRA